MNVLVLGGSGFIGSHLVEALVQRGHKVRVFDRTVPREPLSGIEYKTGNFLDAGDLAEALDGVELVYHLISTSVPSTSNMDPVSDVNGNLVGTLQLLQAMDASGIKRIVFLSSGGTVYGNPMLLPVREDHPLQPICSYGVVKVAIENYLFMFKHLHGFAPIVLRASNPYGPRQGHFGIQGAIQTFLKRALDGDSIKIWGDGSVRRDYIYVADLVDLCVQAGESGQTGTYNAGSGISHSLSELLNVMEDVTGISPQVEYSASRAFDVAEIALDIERAKKVFEWSPVTSIEAGIRSQWNWLCHDKNIS